MRNRILALLLAAGLLLTLAACGGGDPGPAGAPSDSPTESQSPEPSPSEPSKKPSGNPSESPSEDPSESPSEEPSESPSEEPSEEPSESAKPSETPKPTETPEPSETPKPSSGQPSASPEPSVPTGGGNLVEEGVLPTPSPQPSATPAPTPTPSPTPAPPAQSGGVDLQKFYESLLVTDPESEDYFNPDAPVEGDALANVYPGLEDIATKQRVIYQPMISAVACEIALVEVENASDVQKVKDIFQARIDAQVGTDDAPGGAWYPETIEGWKNNSRIVSNGNCVMLIVWENCDAMVSEFNALF